MKDSVLRLGLEALRGRQVPNRNPLQGPAVRAGGALHVFFGFGQVEVEGRVAVALTFQKELQGHRGLTGAGLALHQVEAVAEKAAVENLVQTGNAGGDILYRVRRRIVHSCFLSPRDDSGRLALETASTGRLCPVNWIPRRPFPPRFACRPTLALLFRGIL